MQEQRSIIKKWVPQKMIVPILLLAMFPHLMLFTIFNMNSTFTASFLDIEVDDIQFLFSLAYALMVCTLFIHIRFFQYFNIRSYLLLMTLLNILVLFGMSFTTNTQLILILRMIQAPLTLLEGCILLPVIMSQIKSPHSKLIAYSFLYGLMMTGDKFATSFAKFAIENYNHNMILYTVIAFHLGTLLIYVFLFNNNRMFVKKPLYQLNLAGIFLMAMSLISGAFVLVYGKKYDWFESEIIIWAFCSFCFFGGLFLFHQLTSKRKLFHFEIFYSKRVIIGLMFFFFFYIIRSSMSNIYYIMANVWKWHWEYVLHIQYFNVAGTILGVFLGYCMLKKQWNFQLIFMIGFAGLAGSMYWFSTLFYPDIQVSDIAPALICEGIFQGLLFTPLVMYMLGSVHPSIVNSVSLAGTGIRFWTNTIGFSIMQNSILYLTTKHQDLSLDHLISTHPMFQKEWNTYFAKFSSTHTYNDAVSLTVASIKSKVYEHTLLISNIEIFKTLFFTAFIIAFILLVYNVLKYISCKKLND